MHHHPTFVSDHQSPHPKPHCPSATEETLLSQNWLRDIMLSSRGAVLEHWLRQGCSVPPLVQKADAAEMPPLAAVAALPWVVICGSAWCQGRMAALQVWATPVTFYKSETVHC